MSNADGPIVGRRRLVLVSTGGRTHTAMDVSSVVSGGIARAVRSGVCVGSNPVNHGPIGVAAKAICKDQTTLIWRRSSAPGVLDEILHFVRGHWSASRERPCSWALFLLLLCLLLPPPSTWRQNLEVSFDGSLLCFCGWPLGGLHQQSRESSE